MSTWTAKRFWKTATATPCDGGHTILLDGRSVKTPAKTPLIVPTLTLAQAIAAEWQAQEGTVKPDTMPFTRSANAALDKVSTQFDEVVGLLAAYGETDLICYRATTPQELVQRQAEGWDPLVTWAATALQAPLNVTAGVVYIAQPAESLSALHARVAAMDAFRLTAFHDLVMITGSLVLALAVVDGFLTVDAAWDLSRIDEIWQDEQWGVDDSAAAAEAIRRDALRHAARFLAGCLS